MIERDPVIQPETGSAVDAEIAELDQPGAASAARLESNPGREFRDGETDDATEATEEGLTWIPPTDPPTVVGERGDAVIAAGFGATADEDPFDADHHAALLYPQDEVEARILDALRASAATTALVDDLQMDVEGYRRGREPDHGPGGRSDDRGAIPNGLNEARESIPERLRRIVAGTIRHGSATKAESKPGQPATAASCSPICAASPRSRSGMAMPRRPPMPVASSSSPAGRSAATRAPRSRPRATRFTRCFLRPPVPCCVGWTSWTPLPS